MKTDFKRSILTLALWGTICCCAQSEERNPFPQPLTGTPPYAAAQSTSAQNTSVFSAPTNTQTRQPQNQSSQNYNQSSTIGNSKIGEAKIGSRQTDKSESTGVSVEPPISSGQIFVSLVFVIVLIVFTARYWKRHLPGGGATISNEVMTILGERKVNKQHSICLVRLGSRILVLGASSEGLRTLSEITDPVEIDLLAGMAKTSAEEARFSQSLQKFMKKPGQTTASLKSTSAKPPLEQTTRAPFGRSRDKSSQEVPRA